MVFFSASSAAPLPGESVDRRLLHPHPTRAHWLAVSLSPDSCRPARSRLPGRLAVVGSEPCCAAEGSEIERGGKEDQI
jgi:hypothetical protein